VNGAGCRAHDDPEDGVAGGGLSHRELLAWLRPVQSDRVPHPTADALVEMRGWRMSVPAS
jgi:hypothetical protein